MVCTGWARRTISWLLLFVFAPCGGCMIGSTDPAPSGDFDLSSAGPLADALLADQPTEIRVVPCALRAAKSGFYLDSVIYLPSSSDKYASDSADSAIRPSESSDPRGFRLLGSDGQQIHVRNRALPSFFSPGLSGPSFARQPNRVLVSDARGTAIIQERAFRAQVREGDHVRIVWDQPMAGSESTPIRLVSPTAPIEVRPSPPHNRPASEPIP